MPSITSADVIVVGFGIAGACAAIEAAESGASVVVIDRFGGGGATAISAGVLYAGGTHVQAEAGVVDSVDAMAAYLDAELDDRVPRSLLRQFCEASPSMIEWLEQRGVRFDPTVCPYETSHPTDRYGVYFTGNERLREFGVVAPPAPRGHRVAGPGRSGDALFEALAGDVRRLGVDVRVGCRVDRLLVADGRVTGVEYVAFAPSMAPAHRARDRLAAAVPGWARRARLATSAGVAAVRALDRFAVRRHSVTASGGVVLAAGGFGFRPSWIREHARPTARARPIGTPGDDGAGIRLGRSVGGAVAGLDSVAVWRHLTPPAAMLRGLLVGPGGQRIDNELAYGARLGRAIVDHHGGVAWLLMDDPTFQLVRDKVPLDRRVHRTGSTISDLLERCGIAVASGSATIAAYIDEVRVGTDTAYAKPPEARASITVAPFHALDCGIRHGVHPMLSMTLGGLVVDDDRGVVRRRDGSSIEGLYAAGRTAAGICTAGYVSGLALSEGVFSGRRAGADAAHQAVHRRSTPAERRSP